MNKEAVSLDATKEAVEEPAAHYIFHDVFFGCSSSL